MEYKIYVAVTYHHDEYGNIEPLKIHWKDGRVFEIDKIMEKTRAASMRAGATGTRYLVSILGRPRYLFYEDMREDANRWFVEAKGARMRDDVY